MLNKYWTLAYYNMVARYRDTFLGLIWSLAQPFIIVLSQVFIFSRLFNLQSSEDLLYILSGSLTWFYFSQVIEKSSFTLRQFSAHHINYSTDLFTLTVSNHIELFIHFVLYSTLCFLAVSGFSLQNFYDLFIFLCLHLGVFFLALCSSYLISLFQILYKDLKYIAQFVITGLYFLTPTFYKPSALGPTLEKIISELPTTWILNWNRLFLNTENFFKTAFLFLLLSILLGLASWSLHKKNYEKVLLKI